MSTLKVISLEEGAGPSARDTRLVPGVGSSLALQQDLEAARATIVELKGKLEESHSELERERALRKLLHRQHEEDTVTMSEHASQQKEKHKAEPALLHPNAEAANKTLTPPLASTQREKEKAIDKELTAALKEKEEALRRIRELEKRYGEVSSHLAEGKSLRELLDSLKHAKGMKRMRENGTALVAKVKTLREDNQRDIQDKILMLKEERDAALSKKQGLEVEIMRLQRQLEMTEMEYKLVDKTRVKALQAQLQAAINEKDMWQQKAAKFEDTCETLRVLNCLQRSLSKEEDIKHKYESELQKCHAEKVVLTDQLEHSLKERNVAVQERNQLIRERNELAMQAQEEYERAERFQRLALVLRKRAMASSSLGLYVPPTSPSHDQSHEFVYSHSPQK